MTQIIGHRGSAGTHPENTIASYQEAKRVGADGIEIDIQLSRDEELVVIHDATVNRTTDGKGKVNSFTVGELKKLDAGSWFDKRFANERIPTLDEVLDFLLGNDLSINIEMKNATIPYNGMEEKLLSKIQEYKLEERVIISSFNHQSIYHMRQMNPDLQYAIITLDKLFEPWNYLNLIGVSGIHPHGPKTDLEMIEKLIKRNHPIRVYTINKKGDMEKFIKAKCTAMITDYPEKAVEIRKSLNIKENISC
ncbi:glycerophosphodiester phosphodiesterase [Oceanobacillus longus]|uniref:Glycerophosphodiester phosphodiesterase n=1 Tax=Oceanobacillus longus TaxID=930120 RepID=A0ABV8H1Y7_9BACI